MRVCVCVCARACKLELPRMLFNVKYTYISGDHCTRLYSANEDISLHIISIGSMVHWDKFILVEWLKVDSICHPYACNWNIPVLFNTC